MNEEEARRLGVGGSSGNQMSERKGKTQLITYDLEHGTDTDQVSNSCLCYSRLSRLATSRGLLIRSADCSFWRASNRGAYILVQLGSQCRFQGPDPDVHIQWAWRGVQKFVFLSIPGGSLTH